MAVSRVGTGQALNVSTNTIISEFNLLMEWAPLLRKLCRVIPLNAGEGPSKYINNYGRLTARNLIDGTDLAQAEELSDDQTSYTPSEVGLKVILTKRGLRQTADRELLKNIGRLMAAAYARREDEDGLLQATSFTSTAIGGAGDILGPGHVAAAAAGLAIGNDRNAPEPAPPPWHYVAHPTQLTALEGRLIPLTDVPTGTNDYVPSTGNSGDTVGPRAGNKIADDILMKGYKALGQLFGINIYRDANVVINSTTDDGNGMVFSKEGLILVPEVDAEATPQREEDASLRGFELVVSGSYAWGVFRAAAYGLTMTFDASMPTG